MNNGRQGRKYTLQKLNNDLHSLTKQWTLQQKKTEAPYTGQSGRGPSSSIWRFRATEIILAEVAERPTGSV
jgi:hypothetical protein